ncbi:hypothetical protein PMAYCL1PPCAC_10107, partial [Pristionchus mayeri]
ILSSFRCYFIDRLLIVVHIRASTKLLPKFYRIQAPTRVMNSLVSMGPMIVMDPGQGGAGTGQTWNAHPLPPGFHHPPPHPLAGPHPSVFNPHGLLLQGGPAAGANGGQMPINASMNRSQRCGVCRGCQCKPCGTCTYCQDSPQFGGPGVKKQSCIERRCLRVLENRLQRDAPTFKARVGCASCEDCRMPDCQICLVCLDKRFFDNRYMTGAMCAKKRCNNATSIELPAAAAAADFQQRQAQKRAYEATMEFHMKRRMEMQHLQHLQQMQQPPVSQQQQQTALLAPPATTLAQHLQQQSLQLQLQQVQVLQQQPVPPSLTPTSAATPPALNEPAEGSASTPSLLQQHHHEESAAGGSPLLQQLQPQQQQQQPLMIDPRILAQNNNILSGAAAGFDVMRHVQQPLQQLQQQQQQHQPLPLLDPQSFTLYPADLDYFAKSYSWDDVNGMAMSSMAVLNNGDPFVPPSYAPECKNAVVLQPL